MEQNVKKKDAWELAYKNFLHVSYLAGALLLLAILLFFFVEDSVKSAVSIMFMGSIFLMILVWYFLANKFKRREKNAITWGYALLSLLLVLQVVFGEGLLVILILLYFIYLVYKASKVNLEL